ncbi:hypothetical protein E1B28_002436 [Marasmius oreades]|uniref:Uncharacterized protein n=1 Tax=Marasmius oreades TaxID=181124 RepID=A0A9P7RMM5_9AGAR|nr:uncharacterized protein E1B28_002436 [Marasmius oreades]KAG7086486.1 hypothetical protein E1B28_002436 [Marasmius oreades]
MSIVTPAIEAFRYLLQPIAPFIWFGLPISTLDVAAAFRLCIVLRQFREDLYRKHVKVHGHTSVESRSFSRSALTALTVVFGGEVMACPLIQVPPSFMVSGLAPALYTAIQALVDALPTVPEASLNLELPLSLFDGFSRAYLLCNLIPPVVTMNKDSALSLSPWALLVASFLTANGGFFLTNMLSFMNPTPITLTTPPELQPYGWTTVDLWCAPLITGLYALLTHAQPFWAEMHTVISTMLGAGNGEKPVEAVDPETARAACAMILAFLFTTRTMKNFSGVWQTPITEVEKKVEKEMKPKAR